MTPEAERDKWQAFIEGTLMGSCYMIESDEEYGPLLDNPEFCELLDSLIFLCETCGWWCELSEMAADGHQHGICQDCHDEE